MTGNNEGSSGYIVNESLVQIHFFRVVGFTSTRLLRGEDIHVTVDGYKSFVIDKLKNFV